MPNSTRDPQYKVTVQRNVRVPMRDGVELAADLYVPEASGKFPALLERTPYNRAESVLFRTRTPDYFASRGFLVVVQDVRGRFGSDGVWYPFVADGWGTLRDGYDTVEWLARHPACNGRIGTIGGSFAGMTQMLLAPTRPPHLDACYVRESASDLSAQWLYRGGAFEFAFNLEWNLRHALPTLTKQADVIRRAIDRKPAVYAEYPWLAHAAIADPHAWLRDSLAHPDKDKFYDPFDIESRLAQVDVPMTHMGGWFDIFLGGTLANFHGLVRQARTHKARRAQRLVIGPWMHGPPLNDAAFDQHVGDMDFGAQALFDLNADMLNWFDAWLRDDSRALERVPPVRYFLMGANRWCESDAWPPPGTRPERWYFAAGSGKSSSSLNNGRLGRAKPTNRRGADDYVYDPRRPIASIGGNTLHSNRLPDGRTAPLVADFMAAAGPRDQRPIHGKCLTYTSEPLERDLAAVGPVRVVLFASSSAPDTDFVASLCDVFPDGRSILVCDGILRARYRNSRLRPRLLEPNTVYAFEIDLWSTAWLFAAGHRVRVTISSSCFPRFDANPNTGRTFAESAESRTAANRVYCTAKHPSHVVIPALAAWESCRASGAPRELDRSPSPLARRGEGEMEW